MRVDVMHYYACKGRASVRSLGSSCRAFMQRVFHTVSPSALLRATLIVRLVRDAKYTVRWCWGILVRLTFHLNQFPLNQLDNMIVNFIFRWTCFLFLENIFLKYSLTIRVNIFWKIELKKNFPSVEIRLIRFFFPLESQTARKYRDSLAINKCDSVVCTMD